MITSLIFLKLLPEIFTIILIIIFIIILILNFVAKHYQKKIINEIDKEHENLRKIGEKIPIRYDELEIKINIWIERDLVEIDNQSYDEDANINLHLIILEKKHRDYHFKIEYLVQMEPELLRMKLALQNELYFYYNSKNFHDNFLFSDFLDKESQYNNGTLQSQETSYSARN